MTKSEFYFLFVDNIQDDEQEENRSFKFQTNDNEKTFTNAAMIFKVL